MKYNDTHPELRDGEIVFANLGIRKARKCTFESARIGSKAFNQQGKRLLNQFPVFILKSVFEKMTGTIHPPDTNFEDKLGPKLSKKKLLLKKSKLQIRTFSDRVILPMVTDGFRKKYSEQQPYVLPSNVYWIAEMEHPYKLVGGAKEIWWIVIEESCSRCQRGLPKAAWLQLASAGDDNERIEIMYQEEQTA